MLIGCASNNIINYSDKRDRDRRDGVPREGEGEREREREREKERERNAESRHNDLFNRTTVRRARKHDKNLMETIIPRRIRATNGA